MSPGTVRRVHAILSASLNYAHVVGLDGSQPGRLRPPAEAAQAPSKAAAAGAGGGAAQRRRRGRRRAGRLPVAGGHERCAARRAGRAAVGEHRFDRGWCGSVRTTSSAAGSAGSRARRPTTSGGCRSDVLTVQLLQTLLEARGNALAPVAAGPARRGVRLLARPARAAAMAPRPLHPRLPDAGGRVGVAEPLKNLRHFNATQLLAAGVDLRTTAGRLGHSDGGATTLRVYANWTRPADQRAAELLATDLTALRRRAAAAGPARRRPRSPRSRPDAAAGVGGAARARADTYLRRAGRAAPSGDRAGRLAPGDLLPTVPDIAGHCGLARSTVSRALGLLAEEAVIVRAGTRWTTALRFRRRRADEAATA